MLFRSPKPQTPNPKPLKIFCVGGTEKFLVLGRCKLEMNSEYEQVNRSLENSYSKMSFLDMQETIAGSATKTRADAMMDDNQEESMNFSDILHSEYFKTPQKIPQESITPLKFAAPSKSDIKTSLESQPLGKRSDFEMKFLDKSLDKYMERSYVRRSKRIQNKASPSGYSEINLGSTHEEQEELTNCVPLALAPKENDVSTNHEDSRQNGILEDISDKSQFLKLLKFKDEQYSSKNDDYLNRDSWFQTTKSAISERELSNHAARAQRVITICQNISNQANGILKNISTINSRAKDFRSLNKNQCDSQPLPESCHQLETNEDEQDDLLSLQNFPSNSCTQSVIQSFSVDDLPESLQDLYRKFVKLDFIVHETIKMGKLSLLQSQLDFLEKNSGR